MSFLHILTHLHTYTEDDDLEKKMEIYRTQQKSDKQRLILKQDMEERAQYLMSPKVWQAAEHSMNQDGILLLPQFEQQNRKKGRDLETPE